MLRFISAGESHGECIMAILEGLPAGLRVKEDVINKDLYRRQQGYGRGGRMKIETDKVKILSGIKGGLTLGSPVALMVKNKDFKINELPPITEPRPGHADLAGAIKYGFSDIRCVLERASARETVIRVAAGALCKIFLNEFNININSKVISVGGQTSNKKIKELIDQAKKKGDTLGGVFEVIADNVPVGLGTHVHYDRRLDARLAGALMSIQGIKGVEFGLGFEAADRPGSKVHDQIFYSQEKRFFRKTNNAGGLEGGMSNGEPIIARCAMKPIATLQKPLPTIDMKTKKEVLASIQRSDISAVEAAGVVGEAMTAIVLTDVFLERFGQDDLRKIKKAYKL
ncbi:MAG: chorismate synthase [Candidatus Omnitrophota bacterium]